ncbi:Protein phosphatase 1K [Entamoeba marina]
MVDLNNTPPYIAVHKSSVSALQPQQEPKHLPKRARTRGDSFYGRERPVFSAGNKCVHINDCILPIDSSSHFISKEGKIEQISGTNKEVNYVYSPNFNIGVSLTIGKRPYMEDRVIVNGNIQDKFAIMGIFDGHNGFEAADLVSKEIVNVINTTDDYKEIFNILHQKCIEKTESGTTATLAIIQEDIIKIVHCGDSAAYVITKGNIRKLTTDHNTSNLQEIANIKQNGGNVEFLNGTLRVNGMISVTRSIGDKLLHPPLTADPEILELDRNDVDSLVLMCDGISTVLSEKDIQDTLNMDVSAEKKSSTLRNDAYSKGGKDNMSVVVVTFS